MMYVICFYGLIVVGIICYVAGVLVGTAGDRRCGIALVVMGLFILVSTMFLDANATGRVHYELRDNPDGTRSWVQVWNEPTTREEK